MMSPSPDRTRPAQPRTAPDPIQERVIQERVFVEPGPRRLRVSDCLEQRWPESDQRFWRRVMRDGDLTVNGEMVQAQTRVRTGDVLELRFDPIIIPAREAAGSPEEGELGVLYEDESVLVVDKPAGMHTVPDRGGKYRGVHGRLTDLRPVDDLRIVHRLDLGTSGALLLAKGLDVARALDSAFRAGEVEKRYVALVAGAMRRERAVVTRHLGPDRRRPGLVRAVDPERKGARAAHTDVERVEAFRRHTLVRCWPRTGRSHQIRVHLASLGHGIVGDGDYGPTTPLLLSSLKPGYRRRPGAVEPPLLRRMFLHAECIEFWSPAAGARVAVESPLPAELGTVLNKLRKYAPGGGPR